MRKFFSLFLVFTLLLGCAQTLEDKSVGYVSIVLPGSSRSINDSITKYTINIKGTTIEYNKNITANPGETVTVEELAPESYLITVKGYDASDTEIVNGTKVVKVVANIVTPVQITLNYSVGGGVSIVLILPEIVDDTKSYRPTRNGIHTYSYDSNGFLTVLEDKGWNKAKEVFVNDGVKRTGSEVFQYNDVTKQYELAANSYSVISHDAQNRETSLLYKASATHAYLSENDPIAEYRIEYKADGGQVFRTYYYESDGSGGFNEVLDNVKTYNSSGKLISEEYTAISNRGREVWTWFHGYIIPADKSFVGTYEYYDHPKTFRRTKETISIGGEIVAVTEITLREPGIYVYGTTRDADGLLLAEIQYGGLFKYGNKYAQSVSTCIHRDEGILWVEKETVSTPNYDTEIVFNRRDTSTELYDSNLLGCGSVKFPYEKEEGIMKDGQFLRPW